MSQQENLPFEERYYQPPYKALYRESMEYPEKFWRKMAQELEWFSPYEKVLNDSNAPFFRWFEGGKINVTYNSLDRHLKERGNKVALIWENEKGENRSISYLQLYNEVNKFAYALQQLGVKKGDRAVIYLPLMPELPIAMLALARIGAIHSVVFSGFSVQALVDRINDAKAKLVITTTHTLRRGKRVELKGIVDQAVEQTPSVEKVLVIKRDEEPKINEKRDVIYQELTRRMPYKKVEPEETSATDPLFILYTSGTTGKPKGIFHLHGGYGLWTYLTTKWVFDLRDNDVFFNTADIGWITGHSYIVYGPLQNGATTLMYEGVPDYPSPDRWWELVEKYGVTVFYTSPTAIRTLMRYGEEWVKNHDLSNLRILGSVGEPINPEAWRWYFKNVGGSQLPIVDTWWQTETGGIMISATPGLGNYMLKPSANGLPLPGVDADVINEEGLPAKAREKGYIVVKRPWPGMLAGVWNDPDRYIKTYWSKFQGLYYPGDYAVKDEDGFFYILGRADEVLKIAGHRIGTREIEDILISHPAVAESAVIGVPDPVRGEVAVAAVVLKQGHSPNEQLKKELEDYVKKNLGAIVVFKGIYFVTKLPKTRSGKIMRRLVRAVISGQNLGDTSTLEDEASVEELKKAIEEFTKEIREQQKP
ncbi:MAG: acetate-CoA ligase [Candidatus Aramenus sulfurataquae]|jgi:acetyl-CoA synthetase|uniref:Acetate--CoA ligase n=2 Tax=Candidatus Aramenus sulfurataquae TaxID=1326980 RepID=W7KKU3_9CREN|nr:MAG: acetate-CoA ligase [Candidatus Aramenus sulfurataquae]MCL7343162.1 acetate--CoA ligase [Candidatus Aramenus sulfurataquae]